MCSSDLRVVPRKSMGVMLSPYKFAYIFEGIGALHVTGILYACPALDQLEMLDIIISVNGESAVIDHSSPLFNETREQNKLDDTFFSEHVRNVTDMLDSQDTVTLVVQSSLHSERRTVVITKKECTAELRGKLSALKEEHRGRLEHYFEQFVPHTSYLDTDELFPYFSSIQSIALEIRHGLFEDRFSALARRYATQCLSCRRFGSVVK